MRADDLFAIDVDAEIEKIAGARLQGPFEIPAAFVRRAILAGAQAVVVRLGRGRIEVVDDGAALDETDLARIGTIIDEAAPAPLRHQALVDLEARGLVDLLVLCAARPKRHRIVRVDGRTHVVLEGVRYDRREATRWLRAVAVHAPARIDVDGTRLSRGFRRALATAPLPPPLVGTLALTASADVATVHLVAGGLIEGHLSLPRTLPFEAAVTPPGILPGADAATLRRALLPHLDVLASSATDLLVAAATRPKPSAPAQAGALPRLVLRALRDGSGPAVLRSAPALPAHDDEGGRVRWVSVETLVRDAGPARQVAVLDPDDPPERFALGDAPTLVLDTDARDLFAAATGLFPVRPPLRRTGRRLGALARSAGTALRRALVAATGRLRHPRASTVDPADLTPEERAALARLDAALVPEALDAIVFRAGGGPIRRGRRRLDLPREHPVVRDAVWVLARGDAWTYPTAVALVGPGRVPEGLRSAWRRAASRAG